MSLLRFSAALWTGLLLAAAVVLCWRRSAGALSQPLGLPILFAVAVSLTVAGTAIRLLARVARHGLGPNRLTYLTAGALSAALVGIAAAVSLPGTSSLGLVLLWLLVLGDEYWAWRPAAWRHRRPAEGNQQQPAAPGRWRGRLARLRASLVARTLIRIDPAHSGPSSEAPASLPSGGLPAQDVTQQLTRSRAEDGSETLTGWLRIALAAGQRTTNVHIAFCPPFARIPRISVEQLNGPESRIKVVQLLPYGARCDLKLAGASEAAATILLRLSAQADPQPGSVSDLSPSGEST